MIGKESGMPVWNPWHGCHKYSPGCDNCYVYRLDKRYGRNPKEVKKTGSFSYPLWKNRKGEYKLQTDKPVYICMTSDFFIYEADGCRDEIWDIIKTRSDLDFHVITKRISRVRDQLPEDWSPDTYSNFTLCATCENQMEADLRLDLLQILPIAHKEVIIEPMLEKMNIENHLSKGFIERVILGGESGSGARALDYKWVEEIADECMKYNVPFTFKQTGANFIDPDGIHRRVARKNQVPEAQKIGISTKEFIYE